MTLRERLDADVKEALRARAAGRLRLSVLRMALAAVQTAEIDARRPLGEEETAAVIERELRQRLDAMADLAGKGRPDAEQQLRAEADILRSYLPEPLTADALEALARQAVAEVGATSVAQMGRVMAVLLPRCRGRADGGAAAAVVRRLLQAGPGA